MKRVKPLLLLLSLSLLLAACNRDRAPGPSEPEGPIYESWPPETTDITFEGYRLDFEFEAVEGGYELIWSDDTQSAYSPTGDQPTREYHYRPYVLDNGITRLLSYRYYYEPSEDFMLRTHCEVADFYEGYLIESTVLDTRDLEHVPLDGYAIYEPAYYLGWLDQNHIYLSNRSILGIVSLLTGEVTVPTPDPFDIYSGLPGNSASYLAIVSDLYIMDGKFYYLSYRDGNVLNNYGDIYEADLLGERLVVRESFGIAAIGDNAIAYLHVANTEEPHNTEAQLYCYDLATGRDLAVFTDTWQELDDDYMIVDGVFLGNQWAGKQEIYDNPPYVIEGRQVFFYVSRIGDGEVDRYNFDIGAGLLHLQGTFPAND